MGVSFEDIKNFQIHPELSTTRRHRIVTYLEALPKAQGRGFMVQGRFAGDGSIYLRRQ